MYQGGDRGFRAVSLVALALAMTCGSAAMAQDTAAPTASADDGEIIVTARRTAENVQDISATIDVLSSASLDKAGVNSVENIEAQVPGLQFGNTGFNGAQIGLRGISSQRSFTGDEAAVAVHIDGIFQPQSSQALARMFDVERIEVLKGPQGTLYGRNANAGVINLITKAPEATFGGYGQASYGSFNTVRGEGALNLPLGENQGLRIAGIFAKGDGYIKNLSGTTGGADSTLGKDDYYGGRIRYKGTFGALTADAGVQYIRDNSTRDQAQSTTAAGYYEAFFDSPTRARREDGNAFLQLDVDLGSVGIRSLTGGSWFDNRFRADFNISTAGAANALDNNGTNDGWSASQEFSIYSKGDSAFDWRIGAFYQHSDLAETRRAAGLANGYYIFQDFALTQKGNAYAGFGDVTWHVTDKLSFNVGLRYNYETKEASQNETHSEDAFGQDSGAPPGVGGPRDCSNSGYTPFVPPFPACNSRDTKKYSWDGITGRIGIDYKISSDALLYANYGRGFRSGAVGGVVGTDNFFDAIFGGPGTFGLVKLDEEKVDNYEVGFKGEFLDRKLTFNIAGFYAKFKNMLFTIADPQTFRFVEGNLGDAEVKGVDVLIAARPTQGLTFTLNGEYLESKVVDAPPPGFFAGVPVIRVGNELPRAPRYSIATSIDYTFDVGDAGKLGLFAQYGFKGAHYFDLSNTTRQKAYGLLNLSARFTSNAGFYVFANGNNVLDERYLVNGGNTLANPGATVTRRPGLPATYEVGVGFKF